MIKKVIDRLVSEFEFADETAIGDTVVWVNEGTMNTEIRFAKIIDIQPDQKKDWWKVTFLFLMVPSQKGVLKLPYSYFNGTSFFQLEGRLTWIKAVRDKKDSSKHKTAEQDIQQKENNKLTLIKGGKDE